MCSAMIAVLFRWIFFSLIVNATTAYYIKLYDTHTHTHSYTHQINKQKSALKEQAEEEAEPEKKCT